MSQRFLMSRSTWPLAMSGLCLFALITSGCSQPPVASQEQLRDEALAAPSTDQQVAATSKLVEHGREGAEPLRQVFEQSAEPKVQAAAAKGLAQVMDVDSFPQLIDALDSDSLEVRRAADAAIEQLSGRDYSYDADAEPEQRAEAIARIRQFWQESQQPGSMFIEYRRHPEKLEAAKRKAALRYGGR